MFLVGWCNCFEWLVGSVGGSGMLFNQRRNQRKTIKYRPRGAAQVRSPTCSLSASSTRSAPKPPLLSSRHVPPPAGRPPTKSTVSSLWRGAGDG